MAWREISGFLSSPGLRTDIKNRGSKVVKVYYIMHINVSFSFFPSVVFFIFTSKIKLNLSSASWSQIETMFIYRGRGFFFSHFFLCFSFFFICIRPRVPTSWVGIPWRKRSSCTVLISCSQVNLRSNFTTPTRFPSSGFLVTLSYRSDGLDSDNGLETVPEDGQLLAHRLFSQTFPSNLSFRRVRCPFG